MTLENLVLMTSDESNHLALFQEEVSEIGSDYQHIPIYFAGTHGFYYNSDGGLTPLKNGGFENDYGQLQSFSTSWKTG